MNAEAKAILEAALLCAQQPLGFKEMLALLGPEASREGLHALLAEMQAEWQARGSLQLIEVATGWRFQTHGAVRAALEVLHPERPRRYSRAAMETLAVIAYRQPVTRGDIEDIRGVVVSSDIIKLLEERGWIESIGHRDAPGRPQLYATTKGLLDDLGLSSLSDLPPLDDMGTPVLPAMAAGPQQASLLDWAEAPEVPESSPSDEAPTDPSTAPLESEPEDPVVPAAFEAIVEPAPSLSLPDDAPQAASPPAPVTDEAP